MTIKTGHKRRRRAERTTTKSLGRFFPGLNAREIDHELNQVYGRYRSRRPRQGAALLAAIKEMELTQS